MFFFLRSNLKSTETEDRVVNGKVNWPLIFDIAVFYYCCVNLFIARKTSRKLAKPQGARLIQLLLIFHPRHLFSLWDSRILTIQLKNIKKMTKAGGKQNYFSRQWIALHKAHHFNCLLSSRLMRTLAINVVERTTGKRRRLSQQLTH